VLSTIVSKTKPLLRPVTRVASLLEERRYKGVEIYSEDHGNQVIARSLQAGQPAAIGKLGAVELDAVRHFLRNRDRLDHCQDWGKHQTMLYRNAGVFPPDPVCYSRFCREFLEVLGDVDILAVWFRWGERDIVLQSAKHSVYIGLTALEPYFYPAPWSRFLAGKRVLVISPFADIVQSQYARRKDVWRDHPGVLPEFELSTLQTPLSAALVPPVFPDWFTTLDHLRRRMDDCAFEVAIIGAGAWSLPLAVHAKAIGRWGIHLGGATQILFGIRGRRWDNSPAFTPFFNDAWVRPGHHHRPSGITEVEGACYW